MTSPRYPSLFQINTRVRLGELAPDARPPGDTGRRAGRGAGRAGGGRLRPRVVSRRLADGRGRPARLALEAGMARGVPPGPARPHGGGRHGLSLRRARVPGPRGLRRRRGARTPPRAAHPARSAPDPRLRPEPRGAGPPVGRGAPRVLHPGDGRAARGGAAELGSHAARHPRVRPRSVLRRLAGHPAAQLREPRIAGGDDRRTGEDLPAVRRRALRHGHAGIARRVPAHLGCPGRSVLAEGDGVRSSERSEFPVHGRGLLGPRVDAPAAGVRLPPTTRGSTTASSAERRVP